MMMMMIILSSLLAVVVIINSVGVEAQLNTNNNYNYNFARNGRPSRQLLPHSPRRQEPAFDCDRVSLVPGSLTVDGDFSLRSDSVAGYPRLTADQCRALCVHQLAPRYCIAVNYRPVDGTCLLAGYHLRANNASVHFRRVCQEGRRCFRQVDGWQSEFHTSFVEVPPALLLHGGTSFPAGAAAASEQQHPVSTRSSSPVADPRLDIRSLLTVADFCRAECERRPTCYGFDVRAGAATGSAADGLCPYVEFRRGRHDAFQLHIRECWR